MDKAAIIEALRSQLQEQYERAIAALQDATEGATGDDTKAESKYDTRGLESSYLAAGQAEQADRLARELTLFDTFEFADFSDASSIEPGALVTGELDGRAVHYLLAPAGGGLEIPCNDNSGEKVIVLSSTAPLRNALLDCCVGDSLERPPVTVRGIR